MNIKEKNDIIYHNIFKQKNVILNKGLFMRFFLIFILSISFLFGGGDIRVDDTVEYEIYDDIPKQEKLAIGYMKPKCKDCGEPAKLLPYNGEELPEAETFPCPPINKKGCIHHIS